jgi:hypothetical protein
MRVYRTEAIESQIDLLRTGQEALDVDIVKKRAGIEGKKVQIETLSDALENSYEPGIALSLKSTADSLRTQILLDEARILGMNTEIDVLEEEIKSLNALFLTMQARKEQENASS